MSTTSADQAWHAQAPADALGVLDSDYDQGLTDAEVAVRRARHGANRFEADEATPVWRFVLRQFRDVLVLVLVAAAIVSGLVGDLGDTIAIVAIILLNAVIGTVQEYRADRALAALREVLAPTAEVLRGGSWRTLDAVALVPGDVVRMQAGAVVPADLRLLDAVDLQADEASLTGESLAVGKAAAADVAPEAPLSERPTMLFKGTQVTRGHGRAVVVATGSATELGAIALLLRGREDPRTPLQQRLMTFSRRLAVIVLAICALVMLLGWLRGDDFLLAFMTAVSLAVAAIPEALPAVVTMALAVGAARMGRREALIRQLPAVETLGAVSHICADKTGTLTCNEMTLERWIDASGLAQTGTALTEVPSGAGTWPPGPGDAAGLVRALGISHDATPVDDGTWTGDPTEVALVAGAGAAGVDIVQALAAHPRIGELAFSSERKRMTTIHRTADDATLICCKGAPEAVLPCCTLEPALQDLVLRLAEAWAAEGFRVLAVAERTDPQGDGGDPETGLEWLGLVGIIDPPRPEAERAVAECRAAGIKPIMITGDHPGTGLAIARRVGIATDADHAVTGNLLDQLPEAERNETMRSARVFARVSPQHKIDIVRCLRGDGHFVAMTGDGINDAPALKAANIGIAMGQKGTAVAREAADMVLADDNFATIVRAVREGRRIYDNVRKFVAYTMTSNVGELLTLLVAPLLGMPLSLLPLQILWINLVTDGLPGLAMAFEAEEPDVMRRAPRPPDESLFARGLGWRMLWVGALIATVSVGVQGWAIAQDNPRWQTMVFTVLTLSQLFNALALRFERRPAFGRGFLANRWLIGAIASTITLQLAIIYLPLGQEIFHTQPLTAGELGLCLVLALAVLGVIEVTKFVARRREPQSVPPR